MTVVEKDTLEPEERDADEEECDDVDEGVAARDLFRGCSFTGGPYRPVRPFLQWKHFLQLHGTNGC